MTAQPSLMTFRTLFSIFFCLASNTFAQTLPAFMIESCKIKEPVIAITFDDGPTENLSPKLLDILKEQEVKATLFVIGKRSEKIPEKFLEILKRADAEGHEIGNHTWTHKNLTEITREEALTEIQQTTDVINRTIGKKPTLFRPPFIATNDDINRWIHDELKMEIISASVDSLDWKDKNETMAFDNIMKKVAPGSIIICHETQPTTIAALPKILTELKAKGYRFVTVSKLLAMEKTP